MHQTTQHIVEKLARKGVFTAAEAMAAGISLSTMQRLFKKGLFERVARGVYRVVDETSGINTDYAIVAKRIPNGVLCLISALYFHELTTEIPREIHIAIPRTTKVPRLKHPAVRIYKLSKKSYSAGQMKSVVDGVRMKVFTPEKTIADCFKFRSAIGTDTAVEALKFYLARPNRNVDLVLEMAKACDVITVIRPYAEALL